MKIRIGFDITVERIGRTSLVLCLLPFPTEMTRIDAPAGVDLTPPPSSGDGDAVPYTDTFGNHCLRVPEGTGPLRLRWDAVVQDSGLPDQVDATARAIPIDELPPETLQFLLPSRFCESDMLLADAWARFGSVPEGWARVQAVCTYVHHHIEFGYHHAAPTKSALDVWRVGRGVCRDYAHLTITLLRALNMPARYVSGYLGDIGVPYAGPGDFCAWVEVFVGGTWRTVDARFNRPRIGRVVMVRGRDAADVPMITAFGNLRMDKFTVWCDELPELENSAEIPHPSQMTGNAADPLPVSSVSAGFWGNR